MRSTYEALSSGHSPKLRGAGGPLLFVSQRSTVNTITPRTVKKTTCPRICSRSDILGVRPWGSGLSIFFLGRLYPIPSRNNPSRVEYLTQFAIEADGKPEGHQELPLASKP